jgi:arylesterase / paraoxonase
MRQALAKSAVTLLVVILVVVLFFILRWASMAGIFTSSAKLVAWGECRAVAGLPGPEDFEVDAAHDTIIVSATNRRVPKDHPDPRDGLYAVKLSGAGAPVKLQGTPKDFHPHGLNIFHAGNGEESLLVINHRQNGSQAVEIFALSYENGVPKLAARSSIGGGLLISPNDLAAVAPDHFYVTNDHVSKNAAGRFAEDELLWPHADLLFFDGNSFKISVQRMAFPNGVFVSRDGAHVYVALSNERRIIAFSREPFFGSLSEIGSLSLPARPDNISADAQGHLIVAARPSLLRDNQFRGDPQKPSPSEVFRIALDQSGAPTAYDVIFGDDGSKIGGASSAAVAGNRLVLGSALDDKILVCTR